MIEELNKKKILILTFSVSLVVTEFYFLNLNGQALISNGYLIWNTIFLFIFSIFFLYILIRFYSRISQYLSMRIRKLINILFFTSIYFKILQIPFFLSNGIHLKFLFILLLNKILFNELLFLVPILKILVPFLIIFLLLFFLIKKNFKIINNFITSFVLVFFIMMLNYGFIERIKDVENIKINNIEQTNNKTVIWFILDDYDPRYLNTVNGFPTAFTNNVNFDLKLNNISNLTKKSLTLYKNYSPANSTINSATSTLMSTKTSGSVIEGYKLKILNEKKKKITFKFENTLFQTLVDKNLSYQIVSDVFPYCHMLKIDKNCSQNLNQLKHYSDGIIYIYTPKYYINQFLGVIKKKRNDINFNKLNLHDDDAKEDFYINKTLNIQSKDLNAMIDKKINLIYFHLFIPHTYEGNINRVEKKYILDYFNMNEKNPDEEYALNLKYVDIVIKNILEGIKSNKNKNIMLLLTSDHWRRHLSPNKAEPALFIAKIKGDETKIENYKPILNIFIPDLITNYLDGNISTHNDIKLFLDKKPNFDSQDTYMRKLN